METFTGIWSLDPTSPAESDDVSQGDDQIRGIKSTIISTFPNITATAACSAVELNHLVGVDTNVNDHFNTISASLSTVIARVAELSASLGSVMGFSSMYLADSSTEFSASTSLSLFTGFTVVGPQSGLTASTASGVVAVVKTGIYSVNANLSISSSSNVTMTVALYVDDAASPAQSSALISSHTQQTINVSADVSASAAEEIHVRLMSAASTLITVKNAQLKVRRIG